jgi:hypothetical protein
MSETSSRDRTAERPPRRGWRRIVFGLLVTLVALAAAIAICALGLVR